MNGRNYNFFLLWNFSHEWMFYISKNLIIFEIDIDFSCFEMMGEVRLFTNYFVSREQPRLVSFLLFLLRNSHGWIYYITECLWEFCWNSKIIFVVVLYPWMLRLTGPLIHWSILVLLLRQVCEYCCTLHFKNYLLHDDLHIIPRQICQI